MWTENILKARWSHDNHVICLPETSSNTNPKWRPKWWLPCWFRHVSSTETLLCACSRVHSSVSAACDCCDFKFLRRSVGGKHFMRFLVWTKNIWWVFRVKPPFSNSSGVMWTRPLFFLVLTSVTLILNSYGTRKINGGAKISKIKVKKKTCIVMFVIYLNFARFLGKT